jgi:hypothetical protein
MELISFDKVVVVVEAESDLEKIAENLLPDHQNADHEPS